MAMARFLTLLAVLLLVAGCLRKEEMQLTYAQRCLGCHGPTGRGDGPLTHALPARVPDFRDTVRDKTVFEIRGVIRQGSGVMPAFGPALENWQIQDMVRFVRILSMEGRTVEWWEKFEPFVWAHCTVPWQYVYGVERETKGGES
ncbi:MAG TPA: cytochrome c [Candidatus Binatia bacterium]